jgi:hypothetical protein
VNTSKDSGGGPFNHHVERELALNVAALRNVLLGGWAAARMGLRGKAAEAYVGGLLERGAVQVAPNGIATRVLRDLLAHGKPMSRSDIDDRIANFTAKARAKIVRGVMR